MVRWNSSGSGRGVVSCDWFGVSCLLGSPRGDRPLVAPAGCSVVQMSPTAVWSDRFFILDGNGNKVATFLASPRTPRMDGRRALLEVANRWLYCDNFEDILASVQACFPMSFTGLNRVDLCCDFEMTPALYRVLLALADGSAYVKSLREGVVWWKMIDSGKPDAGFERVPYCITWGGKESLVRWKIYWKWLELHEAAPEDKKTYISDMWRSVGFVERSVWRCEVSVHGSNKLVNASGEKLRPLDWYRDRVLLWQCLYADKFVVRKSQGHKDKRNDEVVPFLEVVGSKALWHAVPSSSRDDSDPSVRIACRLWKELHSFDVKANDLLLWTVRNALEELCGNAAVVGMLCHVYGVSVADIWNELQP